MIRIVLESTEDELRRHLVDCSRYFGTDLRPSPHGQDWREDISVITSSRSCFLTYFETVSSRHRYFAYSSSSSSITERKTERERKRKKERKSKITFEASYTHTHTRTASSSSSIYHILFFFPPPSWSRAYIGWLQHPNLFFFCLFSFLPRLLSSCSSLLSVCPRHSFLRSTQTHIHSH